MDFLISSIVDLNKIIYKLVEVELFIGVYKISFESFEDLLVIIEFDI